LPKVKNKLIKIPLIRIFNGDKVASFKTREDLEEYYEGKVRNAEKVCEYFQAQIKRFLRISLSIKTLKDILTY
jgi:hypothetical protein